MVAADPQPTNTTPVSTPRKAKHETSTPTTPSTASTTRSTSSTGSVRSYPRTPKRDNSRNASTTEAPTQRKPASPPAIRNTATASSVTNEYVPLWKIEPKLETSPIPRWQIETAVQELAAQERATTKQDVGAAGDSRRTTSPTKQPDRSQYHDKNARDKNHSKALTPPEPTSPKGEHRKRSLLAPIWNPQSDDQSMIQLAKSASGIFSRSSMTNDTHSSSYSIETFLTNNQKFSMVLNKYGCFGVVDHMCEQGADFDEDFTYFSGASLTEVDSLPVSAHDPSMLRLVEEFIDDQVMKVTNLEDSSRLAASLLSEDDTTLPLREDSDSTTLGDETTTLFDDRPPEEDSSLVIPQDLSYDRDYRPPSVGGPLSPNQPSSQATTVRPDAGSPSSFASESEKSDKYPGSIVSQSLSKSSKYSKGSTRDDKSQRSSKSNSSLATAVIRNISKALTRSSSKRSNRKHNASPSPSLDGMLFVPPQGEPKQGLPPLQPRPRRGRDTMPAPIHDTGAALEGKPPTHTRSFSAGRKLFERPRGTANSERSRSLRGTFDDHSAISTCGNKVVA